MCSIKELSTHYWTDKESNKTYATVSMTIRMDNGTTKTHEYKCPTPIEEWEEHALSQDNWRKYRPTTPPINRPADRYSSKIPGSIPQA
jgi:hypothetical protein